MAIFIYLAFSEIELVCQFQYFGNLVLLAGQTLFEHKDMIPRVIHPQAPTPKARAFQNFSQSLGRTLNWIYLKLKEV